MKNQKLTNLISNIKQASSNHNLSSPRKDFTARVLSKKAAIIPSKNSIKSIFDFFSNRKGFQLNKAFKGLGYNPTVANDGAAVARPLATALKRTGLATGATAAGAGSAAYGANKLISMGQKGAIPASLGATAAGAVLGGLGSYGLTEDPVLSGIGAGIGGAAGYTLANPQLIRDAVKSLKKMIKM